MAIGSDKARIQVVVDKEVAEKITDLADRMRWSQSKMAAVLLEAAIEDNEWVIRVVTSPFAQRVASALRRGKGTKSLRTE